MKNTKTLKVYRRFPAILAPVIVLLSVLGAFSIGLAQGTGTRWSSPVNLSRSGSATNPVAFMDSEGLIHLFWTDAFSGLMHAEGDLNTWSEPQAVAYAMDRVTRLLIPKLPEAQADRMIILDTPRLIPALNGRIHAFWQTQENQLYYSQVSPAGIGIRQNWDQAQLLSDSSIYFDTFEDEAGNLHLVTVSNEAEGDPPAGVYYRRWDARTRVWREPVALFQSPYFRNLSAEKAHVSIDGSVVRDNANLYVVWDDAPRLRAYFSQSGDGGITWADPEALIAAEPGATVASPAKTRVIASEKQVLVLWQEGDNAGFNCDQKILVSPDQGATWSDPLRVFDDFLLCPDEFQVIRRANTPPLLYTVFQGIPYLSAWNGAAWGELQLQAGLIGLSDPETTLPLQLACQSAVWAGEDLFVVGCDAATGDVWGLARDLKDADTLVAPDSPWEALSELARVEDQQLSHPVLLSDSKKDYHAFWLQQTDEAGTEMAYIYYARVLEGQWTRPTRILAPVDRNVEEPFSVSISEDGRFLVVWNGEPAGSIYFSWSNTNRANFLSEWAEPELISDVQFGQSAVVLPGEDGRLAIAFSVSINEARGVYLSESEDNGNTWSQPEQVFDGAAAGWEIVGPVSLNQGAGNGYSVLLKRYTSPFDGLASMIFGGEAGSITRAFSGLEDLSSVNGTPSDVHWAKDLAGAGQTIHRAWLERGATGNRLWHQYSLDEGATWIPQDTVLTPNGEITGQDMAADRAGRPHLFVATVDRAEWSLSHSYFGGNNWQPMALIASGRSPYGEISASGSSGEHIGVLFTEHSTAADGSQTTALLFTRSTIEQSGNQALPAETGSETQAPISTGGENSTDPGSQAATTPQFSDPDSGQSTILGLPPAIAGQVIGGVIAAVMVGGVLIWSVVLPRWRSRN